MLFEYNFEVLQLFLSAPLQTRHKQHYQTSDGEQEYYTLHKITLFYQTLHLPITKLTWTLQAFCFLLTDCLPVPSPLCFE